ncbi:MAG: hypothetical protein ACF8Q5_15155 [Phycisphaerales bacterium JB040]
MPIATHPDEREALLGAPIEVKPSRRTRRTKYRRRTPDTTPHQGPPRSDKPCMFCKQSCAGLPRIKDERGRYAHKSCNLALKRYISKKRQHQKTHPRPSTADRPRDFLAGLPDLPESVYDTVAPCPECHARVHPRAVLCTSCGHDLTKDPPLRPAIVRTPVRTPPPLPWTLGLLLGAPAGAAAASHLTLGQIAPTALIASATAVTLLILGDLARYTLTR